MSKDKPTYRHLSEEEIRDYLAGKLKGKDAHRLERHMLNDPFDREALEGYTGEMEALEDIAGLKNRIGRRSSKNSKTWFAIAAMVTLALMSGSIVWFNFGRETESPLQNQLSLNKPSDYTVQSFERPQPPKPNIPEPASPQSEAPVSVAPVSEAEDVEQEMIEEDIPIMDIQPSDNLLIGNELSTEETESIEMDLDVALNQSLAGRVAGVQVTGGGVSKKIRLRNTSQEEAPVAGALTVHGQVTDEFGEPLPGVTVAVRGTSKGTVTDLDGSYQIENLPENAILVFAFIGMESAEAMVAGRNEINMALTNDISSLSEVVVVGYGVKKESASGYKSVWPASGMDEYREYLEQNIRYPDRALAAGVEGKVLLKLTLSPNGAIQDIEVKRGLGYGCDEEAIRLVREGPSWDPAEKDGKAVEGTVRVRVKFER